MFGEVKATSTILIKSPITYEYIRLAVHHNAWKGVPPACPGCVKFQYMSMGVNLQFLCGGVKFQYLFGGVNLQFLSIVK